MSVKAVVINGPGQLERLALPVKHRDRFSFEKLVTYRFALEQYEEAIQVVKREACMKAIFAPVSAAMNQ